MEAAIRVCVMTSPNEVKSVCAKPPLCGIVQIVSPVVSSDYKLPLCVNNLFTYTYENTGVGVPPSANSNALRDLCAPSVLSVFSSSGPRPISEISNFKFSIVSAFRMNTYEKSVCNYV
jgi:hypothetical protein